MSSIQRFSQLIPPSGVLEFAGGNFALLLSATVAVDIRVERGNGGHAERFDSQTGGILIRRVQPWANFRLLGTAGSTVVLLYGQADTDVDETDIRLQIATIAGTAAVSETPASALTDTAPVVAANGAQTAIVPANASRKRVTLMCASAATPGGLVFFRRSAGANNLLEVQAGIMYEFCATYGIDVRNDSGGAIGFFIFEES